MASERVWLRRLRWRMRGAWQWPTWWTLTVVEAVLLSLLPVSGDGTGMAGAFLLCGFVNLGIVALIAPGAGLLLRRRRPALPRSVAADYAGTALLGAMLGIWLVAGIVHHATVRDDDRAADASVAAAHTWFEVHAPVALRSHIALQTTWRQSPDLFRTCIPGRDARHALCVYVDTSGPAPAVTRDRDERPNSVIAGPDNPGRQGA